MCILLYVKLIWSSSGFPEIYARLEVGVESVYGYMCIPSICETYVLLSGFPEIYAGLEEKVRVQSAMGICAFFYM